jgi:predicted GIY-YIG superfamily endonuclease
MSGAGIVYLLHFDEPYPAGRRPQHYIGWTLDLDQRVQEHRAGRGGRLVDVMRLAGIGFQVARTWPGPQARERQLKRWHKIRRACPMCGVVPRPPRP